MTSTTYTFHRAKDHAIIATADPATLRDVAAKVAQAISETPTARAYIHNGCGIIAAGICRAGQWHDAETAKYRQFDAQARTNRAAAGYPNDPKEEPRA